MGKPLVIFLLVIYFIINVFCAYKLTIIGDELQYFNYAVKFLKKNPKKELVNGIPQSNSQMPICVLNTWSRSIQQLFNPKLKKEYINAENDIRNGRIISIFFSIFTALYVLIWSQNLFGQKAGLFSFILYLLCPNITANSHLGTTDIYSYFVTVAVMFHLWKYNDSHKFKDLFLIAFFLGFGQLCKQSLILLYPIVFILLVIKFCMIKDSIKKRITFLTKEIGLIILTSILIINIGFLFYNTGQSLSQYTFVSKQFINLKEHLAIINNIPIPLPEPYIQGFDFVAFNIQTPPGIEGVSSYPQYYFFGKILNGSSLPSYYIKSIFFKLPITFFIIFLIALFKLYKYRGQKIFIVILKFIFFPVISIFLFFSFTNPMYLGIRLILLIMPLLFVFNGIIFYNLNFTIFKKIALTVLIVWQTVSVFNYFPHFLPYTNEFILNKTKVYKYFGDGNAFRHEGRGFMNAYLKQNPQVQFEPAMPVKGKVLVSLEFYYDWWNVSSINWLRKLNLTPIYDIDGQYLLFNVD